MVHFKGTKLKRRIAQTKRSISIRISRLNYTRLMQQSETTKCVEKTTEICYILTFVLLNCVINNKKFAFVG
jgi:hypothetical protein